MPFWLIWAFAGLRGMLEVWPAVLVAGVSFAIPQYLVSNFHGPWLVDVVAAIVSMAALALFLRVWQPARACWTSTVPRRTARTRGAHEHPATTTSPGTWSRPGCPGSSSACFVFIWGMPQVKACSTGSVDRQAAGGRPAQLVQKVPPVVAAARPEAAVYNLNMLSATGTGILLAAVIAGLLMGYRSAGWCAMYGRTL